MNDEPSGRVKLTSTCNDCGFTVEDTGDDAVAVLRCIDAAHDLIRPDCPQAVQRAAVSS